MVQQRIIPSEYMAACCILLQNYSDQLMLCLSDFAQDTGRVPWVRKTGFRAGTF
jgi:hypothetical protein